MKNNYYDTSALLIKGTELFQDPDERVIISSITLEELENIKTSYRKDPKVKAKARIVSRLLDNNDFDLIVYCNKFLKPIKKVDLEITADMKILACAIQANKIYDNMWFYSNDICLKNIAYMFLKNIGSFIEIDNDYKGYQEQQLSDENLASFYNNMNINYFDLCTNEYLIIKNADGDIVDRLCWDGETHRPLTYGNFNSRQLGKIKPITGDIQQQFVADSFLNNTITLVKGLPGSGKSFLSLGYLFHLLENHKIDRIVMFCNTVAVRDAAKLGFYPGTMQEKVLDSQVGNILASKLGSRTEVERLIQEGKIVLIPVADARGYSVPANSGVYMTEAQNTSADLMKLILQRIEEDCVCIIEGDLETQVDMLAYEGKNNGMQKLSEVFRGEPYYGEIELKTCHRSAIAARAELMR